MASSLSPMGLAHRAWRLPRRQKALALEALLWLAASRVAVRVSSHSRASAFVAWASDLSTRGNASPADCRIALLRAARISGAPGCLPRALAAHAMLRRSGHAATLTFGVRRGSANSIAAHAWIECEGVMVSGGSEAAHYVALARSEHV